MRQPYRDRGGPEAFWETVRRPGQSEETGVWTGVVRGFLGVRAYAG
ncbi:hypothetical protein AAH991_13750 [Microbispora sp. ZYX-F-249]|uniref:Uncharacterized protein n=1 Tax=Microbispora maris TaxID=3144104 RepID=A0ABV0AR39_9ACTN